ncbi:CLUMA_CG016244, isoform A [Clunio marinus]|uniref:CLUMA_CG016244, isoform A n=1 Tax=Clunio marinus TaxID=568069 RepID=A0A1J1IU29_9DIPT|nr:CLUMA_CG016244, isoform A [Clunio marinus]
MISNVTVVLKFLLIFLAITQIQSGHLVEGPNAENQCGVSLSASGLIYNGKVVKRNQWPFLVALMYTADGKFFCGGTLISRSHVLTAAHCLQEKGQETPSSPSEFVLHLGKYNLSVVYERGSITAFPEKIKIHPDWNIYQVKYDSDIALIKIVGTVPLRSNIYPACLWSSALGMRNIQTGTVIGWGVIEDQLITQHQLIARQVDLRIVTNEVCYEDETMASLISSRTFCAIGENGSGPCKGDSGGGLYMKANIKWFIKGIVSSSLFTDEGMCDVEKYSIFTDVAKFSNWIAKEMDIETDMTCKFVLEDGTRYHCFPKNLVIQQPNVKASVMVGVHLGERNNNDVKEFSLLQQETSYLPHGIPELFPNLARYCAFQTNLKHIQRSDFSGFQSLTSIEISYNELGNIPADTFYDVPTLNRLLLNGNKIVSFDVDLFIKSPNLREFYAYRNQFEYLDGRLFRKNFNLEEIHMDQNKFKHIDLDLFTPLKKLRLVNFRTNTCISEHFPDTKDFESFKAIIATSCSI